MKAKVSRGCGFRGLLAYVEKHDAEQIAGNMAGGNARELSAEFGAVRALRPDILRPVWHVSLSLPEGERLNDAKWAEVARAFMMRMALDAHPWTAYRHTDNGYDHIHIVASRIDGAGQVWFGRHEARHAIEATQAIEREYGLQRTQGLAASPRIRQLDKAEIEMALREGHQPPRLALQIAIMAAMAERPTLNQFIDRLEESGVQVRLNMSSASGRISGISFEIDGVAFKGSQLGKQFSFGVLQKGLDYEQTRDSAAVAARINRTANASQHPKAGANVGALRQDLGNRDQSDAGSGRRDGCGTGAPVGTPPAIGRDAHEDDDALQSVLRRRAERGASRRSGCERVTGSGAVASARLRQASADMVEIRSRLRPVRGAAARLHQAVAIVGNTTESNHGSCHDRPADRGRTASSMPAAQPDYGRSRPVGGAPKREHER